MARPSYFDIDLRALEQNVRLTKDRAANKKICAAVKGDAYGHGLIPCAEIIAPHVDSLAVAFCEEASALRQNDDSTRIVVLEGPFDLEDAKFIAGNGLDSVVHSAHQVDLLLSAQLTAKSTIWLKLDSGMHRLGLEDDEITAQLKRLESNNHSNTGLMSHLGDAESIDSAMTKTQLAQWHAAVDKRSLPTSLLNSAALLHAYDAKSDWVRPGIMLYGAADLPTRDETPLRPVMHFRSAVMALRWINESEVVGYGGRWQASKPTRVATVAVGYADGYPRTACNGTPVMIDGVECPLIGRVSMDMITVDVTELPSVAVGSEVELWGNNLAVNTVAQHAGTIGYELLTRLPARCPRRWSR